MLEINVTEKCKFCGNELSSGVKLITQNHEGYRDVWRILDEKYIKYTEPFPIWHHEGFSPQGATRLRFLCNDCGAEYFINMGPISLYCVVEDFEINDESKIEEEEKQKNTEQTFLKWLKSQRGRGDTVGDFAWDCFHAEDLPRGRKQEAYRNNRAWPNRANDYDSWVLFLKTMNVSTKVITAFKIAWCEYRLLRKELEC